jgi:hypothetical protein
MKKNLKTININDDYQSNTSRSANFNPIDPELLEYIPPCPQISNAANIDVSSFTVDNKNH